MKSLSRVLGISMLASFVFVGTNSAKAITNCSGLKNAATRACIASYDDCISDGGSTENCTLQRSDCFEDAQADYEACLTKGPIPPPRVAYKQNSVSPAQRRSILLNNLSSPRIAVDLRLQ
jgi:hypothetical protein